MGDRAVGQEKMGDDGGGADCNRNTTVEQPETGTMGRAANLPGGCAFGMRRVPSELDGCSYYVHVLNSKLFDAQVYFRNRF